MLNAIQKHKLSKFIKELEHYRGRHTELVSVYVPAGYELNKIINHLNQEQGTASNIKSSSTRKNVQDALERMIQHLRLFKQTPPNGLAAFSGNVAEKEGQSDVKVWSLEPPVPLKMRLYRCDKEFMLDILREMLEITEIYGLIVMDRREGNIALLKGKAIIPLTKSTSNVPGKSRAGGQCLVNDSLIQLSDGSIPEIGTVHNPNTIKSAMIKNHIMIDSNITDKWNVKKNKVYKIITKSPRLEIQSSKDHLFYVSTIKGVVEKAAEELKKGDYLIMPERLDIKGNVQKINSKKYYNAFTINREGQKLIKQKRLEKGLFQKQLAKKIGVTQTAISVLELDKRNVNRNLLKKLCDFLSIDFENFLNNYTKQYHKYGEIKLPNTLNEEFAQFLGYLLGDGCIETDRITFFEQNKQLALAYQEKFNKFFGINSSYRFRESKNYHQIRFTSRPLVRLIRNEFPEIKKTLDSEVPRKILQSNNKMVAAFLKGFFDAEGYVTNRGISFGINNKKLAQQIQLVLLRFSILGSLHEYDNRANKYSNKHRFIIDMTEKRSIELFSKYIGFTSLEKAGKLARLIRTKSDTSHVRQIITPGSKVREIVEKAGYNLQLFPKVKDFFRDKKMMSKQTFKNSILANIKDKKLYNQLKKIYDYPFLPVKMRKIEKITKDIEMVDISVKNQSFIANGIIVHNSSARFMRLREGAAKEFYSRLGEHMKENFLNLPNLKGIIVGGPGPTKYEFIEGNYITNEVKKKIIAIKDITYTGEFGLQELVDRSQDILAQEEIGREKEIMGKFFDLLSKQPGMVEYGEKQVIERLRMGVVDTLLLSEELPDERIEELEKEAKQFGTHVEIISTDTREGVQLKELGKVAAILRYEIQ